MLKGNQHKLDKNKNNKIDAHDFKLLRKEEQEQILEYEAKDGVYRHQAKTGRYGGSEKPTDPFAGVRGPANKDLDKIEAAKKKKKKFSEMVDVYKEAGIKGLFEELRVVEEEASQEEFNKELEKQKKKASGTASEEEKAEVAKPAVQAVQQEEVEQIDELNRDTLKSYVNKAKPEMKSAQTERQSAREVGDYKTAGSAGDVVNKRREGIKTAKAKLNAEEVEQIEERELTASETKKKEEIVKSMKKGIQGFKDRYGDRAKEVMYATATARAKGE